MRDEETLISDVMENITSANIIPCVEAGITSRLDVIYDLNTRNPGDISYLNSLKRASKRYGIDIYEHKASSPEDAARGAMQAMDSGKTDGIIVISNYGAYTQYLRNMISPEFDVDGLSQISIGKLHLGCGDAAPCTPIACMETIKECFSRCGIVMAGKKIAVIGRSLRVGRPLAELALQEDMTVSVYHSKSNIKPYDLDGFDVIVSAIGKYHQWGLNEIPDGKFLIDVGTNYDPITDSWGGDFNYDELRDNEKYITPSPRGIGQVTTTVLCGKVCKHAKARYDDMTEQL